MCVSIHIDLLLVCHELVCRLSVIVPGNLCTGSVGTSSLRSSCQVSRGDGAFLRNTCIHLRMQLFDLQSNASALCLCVRVAFLPAAGVSQVLAVHLDSFVWLCDRSHSHDLEMKVFNFLRSPLRKPWL